MRVLFDTSVLVPALVSRHPEHERTLSWLARACKGELQFLVSAHTLAELYAVLTRLPLRPGIQPGMAWRLIRENVQTRAKVITLSAGDYAAVLQHVSELGLSGGVIFDAIIARAAQKGQADRLLTLNPEDFRRVWPGNTDRIMVP